METVLQAIKQSCLADEQDAAPAEEVSYDKK
jgi:hypothetical protein